MKTSKQNTPTPKTIDMTPTWREALNVYLFALENGSPEGRKAARLGLEQMADICQTYKELIDESKKYAGCGTFKIVGNRFILSK